MKIRKLLISAVLAGIMIFSAGCFGQQQTYNLFSGSYWLSTPSSNVGEVNETCSYHVNLVLTPEKSGHKELSGKVSGTYTTKLKNTQFGDVVCYELSSTLEMKGNYKLNDTDYPVDDLVSSTVYFTGLEDKMFPLHSEKSVKTTTPMMILSTNIIEMRNVAYTVKADYDLKNKTAVVKTKPDNEETKKYGVSERERKYEKISKDGDYFDNETLFFIARAADLKPGFNAYFVSLDPLTQAINRMYLNVYNTSSNKDQTTESEVEIDIPDFKENGISRPLKITTHKTNLGISGTFSGSPVELYYATSGKRRLVKITTQLSNQMGYFNYILKEITDTL